jgi:hypothetical protein
MMVYIYMNENRNTEFLQRRHTGSTGKVMILIFATRFTDISSDVAGSYF